MPLSDRPRVADDAIVPRRPSRRIEPRVGSLTGRWAALVLRQLEESAHPRLITWPVFLLMCAPLPPASSVGVDRDDEAITLERCFRDVHAATKHVAVAVPNYPTGVW